MLDRLILPDRPVEDDALLGVGDGALQRGAAQADGFRGDQDALGVESVQDVVETLAFLADAICQPGPAAPR